jgi:FkbH-like protein
MFNPSPREGACDADVGLSPARIVVAAAFNAEPIREVLDYWLRAVGIAPAISFAPGDQLFAQLVDPSGPLRHNESGINVLLLRLDHAPPGPQAGRAVISAGEAGDLVRVIHRRCTASGAFWVVVCCPPATPVVEHADSYRRWRRIERIVAGRLDGIRGTTVVRACDVLQPFAVKEYYDALSARLWNIPYTRAGISAIGLLVARRIHALLSPPRKVIVLDCDETLWSGACAEGAAPDVVIDPPRRALQEFMRAKAEAGALLCLCSRNEEDDVWAVFDAHPGMVLTRRQITAFRINWTAKSENLRSLAAELQLGLDAFIFVDDDPVACAEVRARLPEVLTIQLPSDPARIPRLLANLWAFDRLSVTPEDRLRAADYRRARERERLRADTPTLDEFIARLRLRVRIHPAAESQLARIAQLTQRTTQCNCTLKRRTEPEVAALHRRRDCAVLAVEASDRYGDYGTVGATILRFGGGTVEIDTFVLSCRALSRRIEHEMIRHAETAARERQAETVRITFVPGPRNAVARTFLDSLAPHWAARATGEAVEYVCAVGGHLGQDGRPRAGTADRRSLTVCVPESATTPECPPEDAR